MRIRYLVFRDMSCSYLFATRVSQFMNLVIFFSLWLFNFHCLLSVTFSAVKLHAEYRCFFGKQSLLRWSHILSFIEIVVPLFFHGSVEVIIWLITEVASWVRRMWSCAFSHSALTATLTLSSASKCYRQSSKLVTMLFIICMIYLFIVVLTNVCLYCYMLFFLPMLSGTCAAHVIFCFIVQH